MNKKNQELKYEDYFVYVGTYTDGNSEGIYICRLEMSTGELRQVGIARGVDNPSYLAIDSERNRLYAVNELTEFDGRPGGGVSAFAIQPATGELSFISQQSSHGGAPCYLTLDRTGRYLLVANYMGGNVAVIPIGEDGALGEAADTIAHSGSSLHPDRQEGPHPHSIVLDSASTNAFVPDLGLDKVMQYRFDQENGRLHANQRPWIDATAGSGPRHLTFHPNGRNAYVINELNSTIAAYGYDPSQGTLKPYQMISTIPEGYSGMNIAADLHLTPNGRYLLGSNRGHNSLAFYAVDPKNGRLTLIDFVRTQGRTPRGFAVDPTGTFVLVANQDSHSVVTFRIDVDQGRIFPTGNVAHIPSPVCLSLIA